MSSWAGARKRGKIGLIILLGISGAANAPAADLLPYTTRTRPYAGWTATARGDIRTVGMAGATVGLADTFLATGTNPAGLAMTLNVGDDNFASNRVHDSYVQNYDDAVISNSYGAALSMYPWGVGFGYFSPYREGAPYIGGTPPTNLLPSVATRQLQFSLARVLFHDRLAVGMGVNFGQAEIEMTDLTPGGTSSAFHSYALGVNLGLTAQLPNRLLLAFAHSTPMHYAADTANNPAPIIKDFFQPVEVPSRSTLGLGWIPNRFFRADLDLTYIGATPTAALIRDQNITVGASALFEPKLGLAYQFADFRNLTGTLFLGTYFETPRQDAVPSRVHATWGIEAKPWILTVGWGIDTSANYLNQLFSLGLDVFKVMEKINLIPSAWKPDPQGLFPSPFHMSDLGLARPLVKDWKQRGPEMNPIDIARDIPKKIGKGVESFADSVAGDRTVEPGKVGPPKPPEPKNKPPEPKKKRGNSPE